MKWRKDEKRKTVERRIIYFTKVVQYALNMLFNMRTWEQSWRGKHSRMMSVPKSTTSLLSSAFLIKNIQRQTVLKKSTISFWIWNVSLWIVLNLAFISLQKNKNKQEIGQPSFLKLSAQVVVIGPLFSILKKVKRFIYQTTPTKPERHWNLTSSKCIRIPLLRSQLSKLYKVNRTDSLQSSL